MDATVMAAVVSAVLGVVVGVVAALGRQRLKERVAKREIRTIVTNPVGKSELVTAPPGTSERDVRAQLRRMIELEVAVGAALENLKGSIPGLEVRRSKSVDFIAHAYGRKVALEVKIDPSQLDSDQLQRFVSAEPGIDTLVIASPQSLSEDLSNRLRSYASGPALKFVRLPENGDGLAQITETLSEVMAK